MHGSEMRRHHVRDGVEEVGRAAEAAVGPMTSDPKRVASEPAPGRGAPARRRRRWRRLTLPAVTVAVLVAMFVGVFPRVADYSHAWSSIWRMPAAYVVALVAVAAVNIAVGAWPLQAALPGLRYGPAFVVGQTSYALSNGVPAGGAIGLGVVYDMLGSYGFGTGPAASAAAISSAFNVFTALVLPVVGVLALLAAGEVRSRYVLIAVAGVLVVGLILAGFALSLRSEVWARRLGRLADQIVNLAARRVLRGRTVDLTGKVLDFRSSVIGVMSRRWAAVIGAALLPQFTSWTVLLLALKGQEHGEHDSFSVTWVDSLAAFSFATILWFLPVTAGGLGTVDAALIGLLTAFGATGSHALAVDLVWRAGTYVPQVLTGALMFLWWQATAGRRKQRKAPP
jgi:uncharacterized protein (TIRG00374 family)